MPPVMSDSGFDREQTLARELASGLPCVEGPRVRLRAAADARAVYELYADKVATRFGYSPKLDSLGDAARLIEQWSDLARQRVLFHWGVARASDDHLLGHATLFKLEQEHRRAEIGYSIRRDHWGQGLGTEAVALLIGFAFDRLDLRRVEADVDPRNSGSIRVLEKLGFQREGYMRERWELGGEIQDGIFYGLLRREWRPR